MKMQIQLVPRDGYLQAVATGTFTFADAKTFYGQILAACAKEGIQRVLIDDRAVKGTLSTTERFDLVEYMVNEEWKLIAQRRLRPLKVAIVGSPPLIEGNDFAETVAANRGGSIKATTDLKEALEWLEENEPEE